MWASLFVEDSPTTGRSPEVWRRMGLWKSRRCTVGKKSLQSAVSLTLGPRERIVCEFVFCVSRHRAVPGEGYFLPAVLWEPFYYWWPKPGRQDRKQVCVIIFDIKAWDTCRIIAGSYTSLKIISWPYPGWHYTTIIAKPLNKVWHLCEKMEDQCHSHICILNMPLFIATGYYI